MCKHCEKDPLNFIISQGCCVIVVVVVVSSADSKKVWCDDMFGEVDEIGSFIN